MEDLKGPDAKFGEAVDGLQLVRASQKKVLILSVEREQAW
jgi:hypothetical protein